VNNTIFIEQIGNTNFVKAEQIGSANKLNLKQMGINSENKAVISQRGDKNEAFIFHEGQNNNSAFHQQLGDYNTVDIFLQGRNNLAFTIQDGNNNGVYLEQTGDINSFKLKQIGDGNIFGKKGDSFIQKGNNNFFGGIFKSENNLIFDELEYAIQVDGAETSFESFQKGDDNKIGLYQEANSTSLLQQNGTANEILVWQNSGGHMSNILQSGNKNFVQVIQE